VHDIKVTECPHHGHKRTVSMANTAKSHFHVVECSNSSCSCLYSIFFVFLMPILHIWVQLMKTTKAIDPLGILNPGKVGTSNSENFAYLSVIL